MLGQPPRMTADEKRLAREMHFGRNIPRAEIAKTLNRNLSSVCRLLAQEHVPAPIGRPPASRLAGAVPASETARGQSFGQYLPTICQLFANYLLTLFAIYIS